MHNPLDYIPLNHWLLLGPLLIAAYTDLRYGMIYNWLTLPAAVIGMAINLWLGGWPGLLWSAIGTLVGFILLYPGFLMGGMAAGDIKLMAAIGAWLAWPGILWATVYSFMMGGLLGLLHSARYGTLWLTLRRLWHMLISMVMPGMKADVDFTRSESPPFVYGPALVIGTILWMAASWHWGMGK
jgi:prepilin peptidase CpaA